MSVVEEAGGHTVCAGGDVGEVRADRDHEPVGSGIEGQGRRRRGDGQLAGAGGERAVAVNASRAEGLSPLSEESAMMTLHAGGPADDSEAPQLGLHAEGDLHARDRARELRSPSPAESVGQPIDCSATHIADGYAPMHAPVAGQFVRENVWQPSPIVWRVSSGVAAAAAADQHARRAVGGRGRFPQVQAPLPALPRQGLVGVHEPEALTARQPSALWPQVTNAVSDWQTCRRWPPGTAAAGWAGKRSPRRPGRPGRAWWCCTCPCRC